MCVLRFLQVNIARELVCDSHGIKLREECILKAPICVIVVCGMRNEESGVSERRCSCVWQPVSWARELTKSSNSIGREQNWTKGFRATSHTRLRARDFKHSHREEVYGR